VKQRLTQVVIETLAGAGRRIRVCMLGYADSRSGSVRAESRLTKRSSVKRDNAGRLLAPFALSAQQCCELLRGPRNKFATTP